MRIRKIVPAILIALLTMVSCANRDSLEFFPINHATLVISAEGKTIFIDPVGSIANYSSFPDPDIILITDIHFDHLSVEIVNNLRKENTIIIGPTAIGGKLNNVRILNNEEKDLYSGIEIEAVAAYNLSEERTDFHAKGRGNGYIITIDGKRIYISGDTEDIPEMRELKNIDHAFVCMNLPWTMGVEQAASGVLDFKPKVVTPYHYRGKEGMSDLEKFKELVSADSKIKVEIMNFYK